MMRQKGLVSSFYKTRWTLFFDTWNLALQNNQTIDWITFDANLNVVEEMWIYQTQSFPQEPQGDTIEVIVN